MTQDLREQIARAIFHEQDCEEVCCYCDDNAGQTPSPWWTSALPEADAVLEVLRGPEVLGHIWDALCIDPAPVTYPQPLAIRIQKHLFSPPQSEKP